jgi:hypothetical protein
MLEGLRGALELRGMQPVTDRLSSEPPVTPLPTDRSAEFTPRIDG